MTIIRLEPNWFRDAPIDAQAWFQGAWYRASNGGTQLDMYNPDSRNWLRVRSITEMPSHFVLRPGPDTTTVITKVPVGEAPEGFEWWNPDPDPPNWYRVAGGVVEYYTDVNGAWNESASYQEIPPHFISRETLLYDLKIDWEETYDVSKNAGRPIIRFPDKPRIPPETVEFDDSSKIMGLSPSQVVVDELSEHPVVEFHSDGDYTVTVKNETKFGDFRLTIGEIREALAVADPDGDIDNNDMVVVFFYRDEDGISDEDEPMPKGWYCFFEDLAEEGCYGPLGEEKKDGES